MTKLRLDRRGFAFAGIAGIFASGCKTKTTSKNSSLEVKIENPRHREVEQIERAIAQQLVEKLRSRNWTIESCQANWFHAIPILQGTRLHWYEDKKGYIFFIRKYKESLTAHSGKVWKEFGIDDEETIYSEAYKLSKEEASQIYINLAQAFQVKQ